MAQTTDFTNVATEHPNYFPGQYLLEDDFALQHKYLIDRIRYQNQSLRVSGIIEGLEVERIDEKIAVQIGSGSAIDSQGHLIVFINENDGKGKEFSDFNNINEGELYIKYNEDYNSNSLQQDEFDKSYTRWQENPTFGFDTRTPDDCVKLATLTISGSNITVDDNSREYSGFSLPNSNGEALTLRSGGNANPNLAVLTGSLQIDENLTVAGTGTSSFAGKLEVTGDVGLGTTNQAGYKLTVQGNQYLDGDLDVRGTIAGNLTVSGAITPSVGNSKTNGIMFPENAFGSSSGDAAWIRYYRREGGKGYATTFEIGTSDDDNDHIALMPGNGGVGIGINDPGSYKLYVQGNQYIKGDLTVSGAGTSSFAGKLEVTGDVGLGTSNQDGYKLTVQGNQYLDGNLDVNGTISGNINAASIISGELAVARIPDLSANKITSGELAVARIPDLSADKITSGTLNVNRIPDLSADKITSGELAVARIPDLSADKITSGTLNVNRISNLSADKITSGTLNVNRIPNLSADKITSGIISGTLTVNGLKVWPLNNDNYLQMRTNSFTGGYAGISLAHPNDLYGWSLRVGAAENRFFISHITSGDFINIVEIDRDGNAKFKGTVENRASISSSDAKLKKNIQQIENGLQKILSLRGVTFQWKEDQPSPPTDRQLGLIAQEVETIFPEVVQMGDDGMRTINYSGLIAPMIEAIKQQQEQISILSMRLEEQQKNKDKINAI